MITILPILIIQLEMTITKMIKMTIQQILPMIILYLIRGKIKLQKKPIIILQMKGLKQMLEQMAIKMMAVVEKILPIIQIVRLIPAMMVEETREMPVVT